MMLEKKRNSGFVIGAPQNYLDLYNENYRLQQTLTEETKEVLHYIENEDAIKAIIAGHTHENFDGFAFTKRQITTASAYEGYLREIEIR